MPQELLRVEEHHLDALAERLGFCVFGGVCVGVLAVRVGQAVEHADPGLLLVVETHEAQALIASAVHAVVDAVRGGQAEAVDEGDLALVVFVLLAGLLLLLCRLVELLEGALGENVAV